MVGSTVRRPGLPIGLLVAVLVLLLAGCTSTVVPASPAAPAVTQDGSGLGPDSSVTALAGSKPLRLQIGSIGVETGLIDLGLQPDGTMEVPADGSTAGWYTESPTPGELGPAVLAAHVDWRGERGIFYDLQRMKPGDVISVERADGTTATFAVQRVEQFAKDRFPSAEVYGDVDSAQLRLITCGGEFDDSARSYRDNVVVFAELAGTT